IGQNKLMQMYDKLFAKYNKVVAQILLTQTGIMHRQRYLNAVNTLNALFKLKAIPIINENDTVAVEEIKFGDNDKLGAMVATMINADLLIILSNIDGLFKNLNDKNSLIEDVISIDDELLKIAGSASKSTTTGGMISKLRAAEITMSAGIPMIICNGYDDKIIDKVLTLSYRGTFFYPAKKTLAPRKHWIKYNLKPRGKIIIDDGAVKALKNNKSLLPSGIVNVTGDFDAGDCVGVYNSNNEKIAKGLCNYNKFELLQIKGLKTSEIKKKFDFYDADEALHIDNMVLIN
ncbi:MAG TPA: glutamate 5-kinase, partial [bacterium]|nr:glutamate 5-kinase [bacterium]